MMDERENRLGEELPEEAQREIPGQSPEETMPAGAEQTPLDGEAPVESQETSAPEHPADRAECPEELSPAPVGAVPGGEARPEGLPPKKKRTGLIVGAAAVVVVIAAVLFLLLRPNPRREVEAAFLKSLAQQAAQMEELQEYPIYQAMAQKDGGPQASRFLLQMESLTIGEMTSPQGALFSQLSVEGILAVDGSYAELEGGIQFQGNDLLSLYLLADDERLAMGLPSFSETVLGFEPATFAEDAASSPLMGDGKVPLEELYRTQANLQSAQARLQGIQSANSVNVLELTGALQDWTAQFYREHRSHFKFQAGQRDGELRTYVVTIPGQDASDFYAGMMRYLFQQSSMTDVFQKLLTPAAELEGKTYDAYVEEILLGQEGRPIGDLTVTLGINGEREIRSMQVTEDADPSPLAISAQYDEQGAAVVDLSGGLPFGEDRMVLDAHVETTRGEDRMETQMRMDYTLPVQGEEIAYQMEERVSMEKSGRTSIAMTMSMQSVDGGQMPSMQMEISADGVVSVQDRQTAYRFPEASISVTTQGTTMGLSGSVQSESAPLAEDYQAMREITPVLSMSQEEFESVMQEYEDGQQRLAMLLLMLLYGAAAQG